MIFLLIQFQLTQLCGEHLKRQTELRRGRVNRLGESTQCRVQFPRYMLGFVAPSDREKVSERVF